MYRRFNGGPTMRNYFNSIIFLLLILGSSVYSGDLKYLIEVKSKNSSMVSEATIQEYVQQALAQEKDANPYYQANVDVYADETGATDYLVVYALNSEYYSMTCYKIDINNGQVATVTPNYIETDEELGITDEECRQCPDESVEVLLSTCIMEFPTAKQGIDDANAILQAAGLKTKVLMYGDENLANIRAYFNCPKLKMWGRVGHGLPNLIQLWGNQRMTSADFSALGEKLKRKIVILNSCQVHNPPMKPAIMGAGAYFYAGGDVNLAVGPSEKVFVAFMRKAVSERKELSQSFTESESQVQYYDYGWTGDGSNGGKYHFKLKKFVSIEYPVGKEVFPAGESVEFKWDTNADGKLTLSLYKGSSKVEDLATGLSNTTKTFTWKIPKDFKSSDDYTVKISDGTTEGVCKEFSIKKLVLSGNFISGAQWESAHDDYTGSNASTIDFTIEKNPTILKVNFHVGQENTSQNIWPWARMTADAGSSLKGSTNIKLSYKASAKIKIVLNQEGLIDQGASYEYVLDRSKDMWTDDLLIALSDFKQPDWVTQQKPLDLSKVKTITITPDGYGVRGTFEIKNFCIYGFQGSVNLLSTHKGFTKPVSLQTLTPQVYGLTVGKAGNYTVEIFTPMGRKLYAIKRNFKVGTHRLDLSKVSPANGLYLISVKGQTHKALFKSSSIK